MAETQFVSTYQGITYKVPDSDKYARFNHGRLVTDDEQVASYLREHPDYGVTLTEAGSPGKRSITVDICICPECGRTFKTREALSAHMKVHKKKEEGEEVS